jgi:lactoylglutathione lyase
MDFRDAVFQKHPVIPTETIRRWCRPEWIVLASTGRAARRRYVRAAFLRGDFMRYLHTMVRISDVDRSLEFYCQHMGMTEVRRSESEAGRFTLIFLAASEDVEAGRTESAPLLELTYNWDPESYSGGRNFGHLAYEVDDIYETCQRLMDAGITINRPPRDGRMAFVKSPDNISFELLQKGPSKAPAEPWASMENTGSW